MTTSTPEKQEGLKILQDAIEKIKATITELGGVFNVQMAVSISRVIGVFHIRGFVIFLQKPSTVVKNVFVLNNFVRFIHLIMN